MSDEGDLHGLSVLDWLPGGCYNTRAAIRAAGNPNPEILRTLLACGGDYVASQQSIPYDAPSYLGDDNEYGPNATDSPDLPGFTSALLQAIISQHPQNVSILLSAGASPDGLSCRLLSLNAAGFLRFGPHFAERQHYVMEDASLYSREHLMSYIPDPQLSPLTSHELRDRLDCPVATRFWSETDFRILSPVENADRVPALIAAAEKPDLTILNSLLDAPGVDTSFWTTSPQLGDVPIQEKPSSLAITTPLHAAISARNHPALSLLLSRSFHPNTLPLAAPTRCITPAMATIVYCDPWNADAYKALRTHSQIDLSIRTPIYQVSMLHLAVARLDLHLLRTVAADLPLPQAGPTALGHTLLHIACLPLDQSWVQMHSEPIFKSCRETRNLSESDVVEENSGDYLKAREAMWRKKRKALPANFPGKHRIPRFSRRPSCEAVHDTHRKQIEVIDYLLQNHRTLDIAATDIHGNTAMHYIASHRNINEALLDRLWDEGGAEQAWRGVKNRHGFTAAELFRSGHNVPEGKEQAFWDVISDWQREKGKERAIWEQKFKDRSSEVVQRALAAID